MGNHFKDVCKHGIIMRQCRCPGPKAEHLVTCDHPDSPDISDLLREDLRQALLKSGLSETDAEKAIVELDAFTKEQVEKIRADRGRRQT